MKKKFFLFFILCFFTFLIEAGETKYYFDNLNGWDGFAQADYLGTTWTINPQKTANLWAKGRIEEGAYIFKYTDKLTKKENFLLWSALMEYELRNNEVYGVSILQGNIWMGLIVVIRDNGRNCDWYGGFYEKVY